MDSIFILNNRNKTSFEITEIPFYALRKSWLKRVRPKSCHSVPALFLILSLPLVTVADRILGCVDL